jgi:hypothetical protein
MTAGLSGLGFRAEYCVEHPATKRAIRNRAAHFMTQNFPY